ncbi:MAG TPA: ABC transporter substrate-binding protein [Terriglobales bacterium]|nr:ABC transporter substrate-binding protein [Terriglobales bacterium]
MSGINIFPRRVASLQPSVTAIIKELGLLGRVVACTKYCREICPEVGDRIILSDSWTAQAEQIRSAQPDLVIACVPYQEKSVTEILNCAVPVLLLSPRTLVNIYSDIALIAGALGAPGRVAAVIGRMQKEIAAVRDRVPAGIRRTVYCEEWGKPIIHSQAWVAELVEAAGGEFVGNPGQHTTAEAIAQVNPDVVIAAWCGAGDRVPLEKLVRDRDWERITAAVSGRVFCIPDEWLNTPAPTLIEGLHALAAAIHPEIFPAPARLRRIEASFSAPARSAQ